MARENDRHGMFYAIGATLCSAIMLGAGGLVLTSFQGHASDGDVKAVKVETARVERESKERDHKLEEAARKHREQAEKEWRQQARFRGAVAQALKITLPPED